ncbi:MAG: class I SAM-dependent methyltransferase [Streptomyces sp.]|nr:class I SAM-dependent methyltransferase [Streptomyces sp.]
MDERVEINRRLWDERVPSHVASDFYDVETFVTGRSTLAPFEVDEVGPVEGKRLCHLQCHFGLDTLTWARLGAETVGIDFSAPAIDAARQLAERIDLAERASFVVSTVEDARATLDGDFDIVYVSWGALIWLPDLRRWADAVASLLRSGGFLYLAEMHPYATALRWGEGYGGGAATFFDEPDGTYADRDAVFEHNASWEFSHGIGDVITAVAAAGLRVEWLHEWPFTTWNLNDDTMVRREDGMWSLPDSTVPLSYSLKASRP